VIFERYNDGHGSLYQTHWKDSLGDHYAVWVPTSSAYEIVLLQDLNAIGSKFIYDNNYFTIENINGVKRPVPCDTIEMINGKRTPVPLIKHISAVATLVPYK